MSSDEITIDLNTLHEQLDILYIKGCRAAQAHRERIRELGVPAYFCKWYDAVLDPINNNANLTAISDDESVFSGRIFTWIDTDRDGDSIYMSVPAGVLDGTTSVDEWAQYTFKQYQEQEEENKRRADARAEETKAKRRAEWESLNKEFGDTLG